MTLIYFISYNIAKDMICIILVLNDRIYILNNNKGVFMTSKEYEYCSKCKNFHQHYVNIENVGIRKTTCGHCFDHKIKFGCEFFENSNTEELKPDEIIILNFLLSVKNYVQYLANNLEQLESQLKNHKNK